MTEVLFYHLERQPLEAVLPGLLERCLKRGWRAVVEAGSRERAEALDAHLWTYRDDSFLPHGLADGEAADAQPIVLAAEGANPNAAEVRFFVDGAAPSDLPSYQRVVILFDGHDKEAVESARMWWKQTREDGHDATYWQQAPNGKWDKKS